MSSERFKQLVQQIQKAAQVPTRSKGEKATAPAPSTPHTVAGPTSAEVSPSAIPTPSRRSNKTAPANTGNGMGHAGSLAVKTMQQNLINLANVAASTDATAMNGNQDGQQEGNQSRLDPNDMPKSRDLSAPEDNKKNYLGGSDPFGKFVVQNYIPRNSFTARQYLNVDVSGQENRENASTNAMSLRGLIDTIKRVGSPNGKGEHIPDGVWQTRTNNALHVVGDLIQSFVGLAGDMGNDSSKAMAQVNAYKELLPESWKDLKTPEEMNKRAEAISKHLVSFTRFVQSFNEKIVNNPTIKQFIDQKEPFDSFKKKIETPLNAVVPDLKFSFVKNQSQNWIFLHELDNMENFKKFVTRVGFDSKNPTVVKQILDEVTKEITDASKIETQR